MLLWLRETLQDYLELFTAASKDYHVSHPSQVKFSQNRKSHRDLIAGLNTPMPESTFVQPTEHKQLLQWYLFQLPQPVRFYTWGHCIGQRFIDALIYNRSRYDLVARVAAYRDAWPL